MSGISLGITIGLSVLTALGAGILFGSYFRNILKGKKLAEAESDAKQKLEDIGLQTKSLLLEAKDEASRIRSAADEELKERRGQLLEQERRLIQKDEGLERRGETLVQREAATSKHEQEIEGTQARIEELKEQQLKDLEEIAKLSLQEARNSVFQKAEESLEHEIARRYRDLEQEYKDETDQKARKYIALAIQRLASDVVSESTTKLIPIPNDEMKGRLIGREGRNIRAIEQATGVDLVIDDTPQAVSISCFDPIRRETARITLENLIKDGRIHPTRVEEMAEKARIEVDESIRDAGQQAVFDSGVRGIHPELVKLLGRLKFRTSYGGNVLTHSVEASLLAGMIASELGANVQVSKAGALLHDIGKALTHEIEGPHAEIGAEMATKYQISDPVRQAIEEHHDEDKGSLEAFVVVAADAISSARPGARSDTLEQFAKRMRDLEEVGNGFPGVDKCFAIQAGREIRILVEPDNVLDDNAPKLARDVAKKIEETLAFPGQIKVTVIRETRSVEYAR